MIEFSAILLLYVYLALMAILVLISLGHVFHAIRFGGLHPTSILTSGVFIAGIAVIAWASNSLLFDVDWSGAFAIDLPSISFFSSRK